MNNQLLVAITMMCYAVVSATEVTEINNGFAVITGHGEVLPDGVTVKLIRWEEGSGEIVATDTIENGQFRLETPVGEGLTIGSISFDSQAFPPMSHWLYLTPDATVEINAIDRYMFTWPIRSTVPEQAEFDLFIDNSKDLWTEYQTAQMEYYKSENLYDTYIQKTDSLRRLIYLRDLELLKTRPVSMVWLDKAIEFAHYSKITSEDMHVLYANLDDSIKNSPKGRALYGYLYPGSQIGIGDKFPDNEFDDIEAKTHRFSEFLGKWVLVDFWKAGCVPCIQALPELRELKEKYPETLELVSLSLETDNMWRRHSEKLPLIGHNWNEGKGDYGIFRRLRLSAFPTFLLISPDGTIKDIWIGYSAGKLKQKLSLNL